MNDSLSYWTAFIDTHVIESLKKIPLFGDWGSVFGTLVIAITCFHFIRTKLTKKNYKDFWNPNKKKWKIIKPKYVGSMARVEDILASNEIKRAFKSCEIPYEDTYDDKVIKDENNLIYICGPIANKASKDFCEQHNLTYEILHDSNNTPYIIDKKTGNKIFSPLDLTTINKNTDMCIVGRIYKKSTNTYNTFVFGLHGVGTYGGARYLASHDFIRNYSKKMKGHDFIFLVKVDFHEVDDITSTNIYSVPYIGSEVMGL